MAGFMTLVFLALVPAPLFAWTFGNADSEISSTCMSGNGRYVVFASNATNFASGDTNGCRDIFRLDTQTGQVERVSVSSAGVEANGISDRPAINCDGTKLAFYSVATNLVTGDTNGTADVFLRDMNAGTTTRVSLDSSGNQVTGGESRWPSINGDGTKIAFSSRATNLVANDTNGTEDIFLRDLSAGTTVRVSVDSSGNQATNYSDLSCISADGTKVGFGSMAANLVANDTNGMSDVFVRDVTAGTTVRVSVDSSGNQAAGSSFHCSLDGDGSKAAFHSDAANLVPGDTNALADVFVRDLAAGTTVRVSVNSAGAETIGGNSLEPAISYDGSRIVFHSAATNLVTGDANGFWDVFMRDTSTLLTSRVSLGNSGNEPNGGSSWRPAISDNGIRVAFYSYATDLVPGDTNGKADVFVRDLTAGTTTVPVRVSAIQVE